MASKLMRTGSHLIHNMRTYYSSTDHPAPITSTTALLLGLLYTTIYIAPFYLSPTLRSTSLASRDSPTIIRARVRAVGLSCLTSTLITLYVLLVPGDASPSDVLRLLGLWPVSLIDCVKVVLLLCVLFAGPLYESILIDDGWRAWNVQSVKDTFWTTYPAYRNMLIAPWCEELVFRSLVISLYLLAQVSPARMVFLTPLIFGAAHVHHLIDYVRTHTPAGHKGVVPPLSVLATGTLISTIQLTYTSLFGFFAAFVFLRTGNVFASVAAHTFCNFMGLPRVWGRVGLGAWPAEARSADGGLGQDSCVSFGDAPMGWTVLYYVLLVGGAVGFYVLLWPLTESGNALVSF
ncbi:uncharacterized protein MYCGRDRAFT_76260 [Zymoseptoria tritici IPO323]|uniref:intramembrane prenyl-peptidase Rce1 n=1 Tax=Zymoseptoria tritici (strain CBS 115943 / IPO323) TaxID=336722 RepID=F9XKP7_ZYMTI|nr:uncharacterized protein MYCGRDRAFT_76260 [Zymoseptoria tritici IPO323]EGP83828.1 hypothetical protein MYCGRDRAFT_76260 [Zymoseptoria tritici IPO323]